MSLTRQIAHNTLAQMIGKAASTVTGLVAVGMMTRYLGDVGYGQYTTAFAFLQFFGIVVDFGLYIVLIKRLGEHSQPQEEERLVNNLFTLRLLSAIILLGLAPVIAWIFFDYPPLVQGSIIIGSFMFLFVTLNQLLMGVFQKHFQIYWMSIAEVVGRFVLLGAIWWAIVAQKNLLWIVAAFVLSNAVIFAAACWKIRKWIRLHLAWDFSLWKSIIREATPIAISIVFNLIYFKLDTLVLQHYHGDAVTGIYGAPYKVLEVLISIPAMFAGLLTPLLAQSFTRGDPARFQTILQRGTDVMIMTAVPLVVGGILLGTPLMEFVAGEDFLASGPVLQILIIPTAFIFVGNLFANAVVAIQKQRTMLWGYISIAALSVVLYLTFIPPLGLLAAATITAIVEGLSMGTAILVVLWTIRTRLSLTALWKAILASVLMGIAIFFTSTWHVLLVISFAIVIYLFALYLLKGFTKEMVADILKPSR
jgi:O-antigen/teichoic acid export membrane protein